MVGGEEVVRREKVAEISGEEGKDVRVEGDAIHGVGGRRGDRGEDEPVLGVLVMEVRKCRFTYFGEEIVIAMRPI